MNLTDTQKHELAMAAVHRAAYYERFDYKNPSDVGIALATTYLAAVKGLEEKKQ